MFQIGATFVAQLVVNLGAIIEFIVIYMFLVVQLIVSDPSLIASTVAVIRRSWQGVVMFGLQLEPLRALSHGSVGASLCPDSAPLQFVFEIQLCQVAVVIFVLKDLFTVDSVFEHRPHVFGSGAPYTRVVSPHLSPEIQFYLDGPVRNAVSIGVRGGIVRHNRFVALPRHLLGNITDFATD